MFKRKYVKISSEKVLEKIENFLIEQDYDERLPPKALYAFRYLIKELNVDIENSSLVQTIGLTDIKNAVQSSSYVIYSDEGLWSKRELEILTVCKKLTQSMIFICTNKDEDKLPYVEHIYIYQPVKEDCSLPINGIYYDEEDICCDDSEKGFLRDLEKEYPNTIKFHLQDGIIVGLDNLDYNKEFFSFTNLDIEGSTITFHYVP